MSDITIKYPFTEIHISENTFLKLKSRFSDAYSIIRHKKKNFSTKPVCGIKEDLPSREKMESDSCGTNKS